MLVEVKGCFIGPEAQIDKETCVNHI